MAIVFSIDYYKNDGSGTTLSVSSASKRYTDYITSVGQNWGFLPQDWSRDGYTFVHWNTESDDSGDSYDEGVLYTGTEITLYAIWQGAVQTPDISISLGNTEIATLSNSGSVSLATEGTFLTEDISVQYTAPTPTLTTKSVTANGTYNASSDNADGYSSVTVNVPNPSTGTLSITANDTYDVTNYASAVVSVPNPSTGTLSISENGTYDVTSYASAEVNVSGGGGGSSTTVSVSSFTGNIYYVDSADGTLKYASQAPWSASVPSGSMVVLLWNGPKPPDGVSLTNLTLVYSVSLGSRATYRYADFCIAD